MHRSSDDGLEASIIRIGPRQATCFLFEPALCHVRRWLRDGRAAECTVDVNILANILAPPGCYDGIPSLNAEDEALYYRQILHCEELNELKKWIIACRYTGSNTEGLTVVGDEDYMWILHKVIGDVVPTQFAGYYHIRPRRRLLAAHEEFLPNDKIKNWLFVFNSEMHTHGPAVTSEFKISKQTEDNVMALQWNRWPVDIDQQQFLSELCQKLQPFVRTSAIETICALPLLFIPTSHPLNKTDTYCWRMSFAVHEREIMNNFIDPDRKRVFCLLRIIINNAKHTCRALTAIKSYHIKTAFLWFASFACDGEEWNLMNKFIQLCENLESAFLKTDLRNFFLPQQNLIGHLTSCRLRSVAKWIRSHLLSDSGQRETFLAVLHGMGCENMDLQHDSCRSAVADCASSFAMAIKLPNSVSAPRDDYYVSLLQQVAQLLQPLPGDVTDNASVNAVFHLQRIVYYIVTRDPCSDSPCTREFLSIAPVQMMYFALKTNDLNKDKSYSQTYTRPIKKKSSGQNVCRVIKGTKKGILRGKDVQFILPENVKRKYKKSFRRTKKSTRKSPNRKRCSQKTDTSYRWQLTNAILYAEPYFSSWRHTFRVDLKLFTGNRLLTSVSIESEILPLWLPTDGNYLVNYASLGSDLLFALHAFNCYRSPAIVQFALHYLDWLDAAGNNVDLGRYEWLYENKVRVVRELMEALRPSIDPAEWKNHVKPSIYGNTVMLAACPVVTLLLCSMAEFHHRNQQLRQRCAGLRDNVIALGDEFKWTPFEAAVIKHCF